MVNEKRISVPASNTKADAFLKSMDNAKAEMMKKLEAINKEFIKKIEATQATKAK